MKDLILKLNFFNKNSSKFLLKTYQNRSLSIKISSSNSNPPKNRALVDLALITTGFISIGATIIWIKSNQSQKFKVGYLYTNNII